MVSLSTLAPPPSPLLPRVAAGDDSAMRQLVRHFTPLVRSIARRSCSHVTTPDDLVQETMLRLWRSAERFDPARGTETTFVASVARNAAIDMARRRACRPAVTTSDPELLAPPASTPTEHVATVVTVRAALTKLPPATRDLLRLAYFEQLTQREIAHRLGIPLGTVKSRTSQAMATLRAMLRDDD
jgi:RNA polymerase sigma factor (sigma-70 family)